MTKINKDIEKYLSQVKSYLHCKKADKDVILEDIRTAVFEFSEEFAIESIDDIYRRFGTPEEIAKAYLSDAEPSNIKKAINIRKVIIAAVIAVIVIYLGIMIFVAVDAHNETHGYFTEIACVRFFSVMQQVSA
ncbi:MAG: hypothetical protein IJO14_05130 [Clostridia bacterium]|nr:hypothetical protein [Clostridia bacterium]